ncbi:MAG: hypothetical protein AB9856_12775 [Cellulosilyticaceae bacterium]
MKWNEKVQYKAKNYLYQKERNKNSKTMPSDKPGFLNDLMETLDEMDNYIEEIIDEYLPKKNKK